MTDRGDDDTLRRQRPGTARRYAMSDSERSSLQRTPPRGFARGVPTRTDRDMDASEDTDPRALLVGDASQEDVDLVMRLGRDPNEPVSLAEFAKWVRRDQRHREEYRRERAEYQSGNKDLEQRLIDFLNRPPDDSAQAIHEDVADLKRSARVAKWVIGFVLTAALGSLATGVGTLWGRAEREGETNVKIDRLQQDVQQLLREQRHYQPKDLP